LTRSDRLRVAAALAASLLAHVAMIYAILHLSYGVGFLAGVARFCGRWREPAARRSSPVTGGDSSA